MSGKTDTEKLTPHLLGQIWLRRYKMVQGPHNGLRAVPMSGGYSPLTVLLISPHHHMCERVELYYLNKPKKRHDIICQHY